MGENYGSNYAKLIPTAGFGKDIPWPWTISPALLVHQEQKRLSIMYPTMKRGMPVTILTIPMITILTRTRIERLSWLCAAIPRFPLPV